MIKLEVIVKPVTKRGVKQFEALVIAVEGEVFKTKSLGCFELEYDAWEGIKDLTPAEIIPYMSYDIIDPAYSP